MESNACVKELEIQRVKCINLIQHEDNRGSNVKVFSKSDFMKYGIDFSPLEILSIHSNKYVLRGLHFQREFGQSKVIMCCKGKLLVVVVDMLLESSTYGNWCYIVLDSPKQIIYIPKDCAVGTLAIQDADFMCMCGENPYIREYDTGVRWNDKTLGINWLIDEQKIKVSERDALLPLFI